MKFEDVKITTKDGATLQAWYFPSNLGDQLMIISHDGVGNMGDYLERVRILVQYGFSVITYDYRGYGTSSEFNIDKLQYVYKEFFTDFDAVVEYCSNRFHHEIIAYGWGIGGGISITHGFDRHDVTGIICDDPFIDFTILKTKFKEIQAIMKLPSGIEHSDYSTFDVVKGKPGPDLRGVLYLHGDRNYLFSYDDMQNLLDATNLENKELIRFKKSGHMDNFKVNESTYARNIYGFVMNL
ncbi:MAG: alpha/beta hydrolase [Reichenbachiella sp.]